MAFGKRIKRIRQLKGFTLRDLGERMGFTGKTADIRVSQYEAETRKPKDKIAEAMAYALDVPTFALDIPNIDTRYGVIHTLFALEDEYGFKINNMYGEPCITLEKDNKASTDFFSFFCNWYEKSELLRNGEITKEEYDQWRYSYPASAAKETRASLDALRNSSKSK